MQAYGPAMQAAKLRGACAASSFDPRCIFLYWHNCLAQPTAYMLSGVDEALAGTSGPEAIGRGRSPWVCMLVSLANALRLLNSAKPTLAAAA